MNILLTRHQDCVSGLGWGKNCPNFDAKTGKKSKNSDKKSQKTAKIMRFERAFFSKIVNILLTRHQDWVTGLDWGKNSSEKSYICD